jgi:hypothetical protein
VLFSAKSEIARISREAGADGDLLTPFDFEELGATIQRLFG